MSTIEITYDGVPLADVLWQTASFESQMGALPGTFEITVRDIEQVYGFTTGKHITLTIDGQLYFGGIVTQVSAQLALPVDDTVTAGASGVETRQFVLRGVDYNIWFDKRVLFNVADPVEGIPPLTGTPNDQEIIVATCTNYLDLSDTDINFTTYVDVIANPYGSTSNKYNWDTPSVAWREVMHAIARWTGGIYYIDHSQFLHYHALETVTAPWSFSDTPDKVDTFGFRQFSYTEDGSNLVNDALMWGGSSWTSVGVDKIVNFGRYENPASIAARGRWQKGEKHFNREGYDSNTALEENARVLVEGAQAGGAAGVGDTVSGLVNPQKQIRLTWFSDAPGSPPTPIIPGSVVGVEINSFGLDLDLPVRNIRISFATPTVARFEGFFGLLSEDPWTLWKYIRGLQQPKSDVDVGEPLDISDGTDPADPDVEVGMEPTPVPDDTTTVFFVTDAYIASSTQVWLSGLMQRRGIDYTESDPATGEITFTTPPASSDWIWVQYVSAGGQLANPPAPPPGGEFFAPPTTTDTFPVPASIGHVGTEDVSAELNAWIDTVPDGSIISFDIPDAIYRLASGGMLFQQRSNLQVDGNGWTNIDIEGNGNDEARSAFLIRASDHISIDGFTVVADGVSITASEGEAAHALGISGYFALGESSYIALSNVTASHLKGDGVYIEGSNGGAFPPTHHVWVYNCDFDYMGRNGVSFINCTDVLIESNTFDHVSYHAVDFEANFAAEEITNVTVRNNSFGSYAHRTNLIGFFVADSALGLGSVTSGVLIDNNTVVGIAANGYDSTPRALDSKFFGDAPGGTARHDNISFTNNSTSRTSTNNPVIYGFKIDTFVVTGNTQPLSGGGVLVVTSDCTGVTDSPNP